MKYILAPIHTADSQKVLRSCRSIAPPTTPPRESNDEPPNPALIFMFLWPLLSIERRPLLFTSLVFHLEGKKNNFLFKLSIKIMIKPFSTKLTF